MLGMVSGWSSTFEPEPTGHSPADSPEKEREKPENKVTKPMTSFHGILTDYAMVGNKKYSSNEYATLVLSPSDKVTFSPGAYHCSFYRKVADLFTGRGLLVRYQGADWTLFIMSDQQRCKRSTMSVLI